MAEPQNIINYISCESGGGDWSSNTWSKQIASNSNATFYLRIPNTIKDSIGSQSAGQIKITSIEISYKAIREYITLGNEAYVTASLMVGNTVIDSGEKFSYKAVETSCTDTFNDSNIFPIFPKDNISIKFFVDHNKINTNNKKSTISISSITINYTNQHYFEILDQIVEDYDNSEAIGGSIVCTINSGDFIDEGTEYTLTATPNPNYDFEKWHGILNNSEFEDTNLSFTSRILGRTSIYPNFSKSFYTISTNIIPENGGTITGGGTYANDFDNTIEIFAIPNIGYKFVKWSDEEKENPRFTTITKGTQNYTAIFEPVYITYDSIFNFQRWYDNGISGLGGCSVIPASDSSLSGNTLTGFDLYLQSEGNDAQTTQSPVYKVEKGKTYTFEVDATIENSAAFQTFVFYCDIDGNWTEGTHTEGVNTYSVTKYNFTPTTDYIRIRCDIDGQGQYPCSVWLRNFRIYPVESEWMSNSLTANKRSNSVNWNIPLPERYRYTFDSWQDIKGNIYNNNSTYPTEDLVLYSNWKNINLFYELLKSSQIYYEGILSSDIYFEGTKL